MDTNHARTSGGPVIQEPHPSWLDRPLADFMIRNPVYVQVTDTLRTVQMCMNRTGAGHIPVLDRGRPVGIVTARDLARSMPVPLTVLKRDEMERLLAVPVEELMSTPVVALPQTERLAGAVARMVEEGVGAVLVIDPENGELVGLVTRSTVVNLVARSA
jgi:CBS domain-containing protein